MCVLFDQQLDWPMNTLDYYTWTLLTDTVHEMNQKTMKLNNRETMNEFCQFLTMTNFLLSNQPPTIDTWKDTQSNCLYNGINQQDVTEMKIQSKIENTFKLLETFNFSLLTYFTTNTSIHWQHRQFNCLSNGILEIVKIKIFYSKLSKKPQNSIFKTCSEEIEKIFKNSTINCTTEIYNCKCPIELDIVFNFLNFHSTTSGLTDLEYFNSNTNTTFIDNQYT